jgi:hypothetical protein
MKVYAVSLNRLSLEYGFSSDPITYFYSAKWEAIEMARQSLPVHDFADVFCYRQPIRKLGDIMARLNEINDLYGPDWEMVASFEPVIEHAKWAQTYPTRKTVRL